MSQSYAITPDDVVRAARIIRGHVLRTPLVPAPRLSELTGARVLVKHENMQATGAFKERVKAPGTQFFALNKPPGVITSRRGSASPTTTTVSPASTELATTRGDRFARAA